MQYVNSLRVAALVGVILVFGVPCFETAQSYSADKLSYQKTCPPCRQAIDLFGEKVWVEFGKERVYVCCAGCAAKMQKMWQGYRDIMTNDLKEAPMMLEKAIKSETPVIHNPENTGVCEACRNGACMKPEHLPGEHQDS